MGNIHVLSYEVANLIAAGEVVERPSSVAKELLENSVDAGAKNVTLEIRNGGVSLLSVTDDGCGMSPEDMPVSLRRHATSKIKDAGDLESILTLGFRGEALAAISSVSDMTIVSKTKENEAGTLMKASGGQITEVCEVGCADGTTITVEHLFETVPARRKFLKKDATETSAVAAVFEKIALSHPEVAFTLICDGKEKAHTTGDSDVKHVLFALYGATFAKQLLELENIRNDIHVTGYVGRSENTRNNRNYQNIFLNGRYVKSKTVMAALEQAFTSFIAPERFPVCAIYLTMDPHSMDINVHPSKLEVKFADEKSVFEAVYYAVKSALETAAYRADMSLPSHAVPEQNPVQKTFTPETIHVQKDQVRMEIPKEQVHAPREYVSPKPTQTSGIQNGTLSPKESLRILEALSQENKKISSEISIPETFEKKPEEKEIEPKPVVPEYRYIGEAFHCYLLVETEDGLYIIDKHAAHERVLFEDLKKQMEKDKRISSQELLLPVIVRLTAEEMAAAKENMQEFTKFGFRFVENEEEQKVELLAIPTIVSYSAAGDLFTELCNELASAMGNIETRLHILKEKSLYQIACKGAIKGGRVYTDEVHKWLIEKLLTIPDIKVCPHGRPVLMRLTKTELDQTFDRIK